MRHFLLVCVLMVMLVILAHGQCTCTDCPISVNNNSFVTTDIDVSGLTNGTLGSGGQGICEIRMNFLSDAIRELEITMTTPSGQSVVLIPRISGIGVNQNLTYDISFLPCNQTAIPDPGFAAIFDPLASWINNSSYTGSYYPGDNNCLENLTGNANGTYSFEFEDFVGGDGHDILSIEIIFCDGTNLSCTPAPSCDPGQISSHNPSGITEPQGSGQLVLDYITENWIGSSPDPSLYGMTYTVQDQNNNVLARGNPLDLTAFAPGTYFVCGVSYLLSDGPLLPPETGGYTGSQILNDIFNGVYCADRADICLLVTITSSCDPGDLSTVGPIFVSECEGRPDLLFDNLTPSFIGPAPGTAYGVTYFVSDFSTGTVIERNDVIDLTTTPPGTYRICGLSYLIADLGNLPSSSGGYTIPDVQQDIVNGVFCGDLSDNCTLVTISPDLPAPTISWPATMCVGTTYTIPITNYDPSLSYTLQTTSGAFSTLFFDNVAGEIVINPASDIFDINICVSIAEDCDNSQSCATIAVIPSAPTPLLSGPVGVCTGDGGTVIVTNAQAGDTYTWSITGPGSITSNSNDQIDFTSTGPGTVQVCAETTGACGTVQQCLDITVSDPAPPSTNAQATYCLPTNLFAGNPNGGSTSMLWEQISGPGTITFFNPNIVATSWTADLPGIYVVRLTKEDNGCITFDEATIELLAASVPPTLTGPPTFCANEVYNVAITNPDPNTSYAWSTNGPGVITADNGDNVDVEINGNGSLQVCVDATNQCGTSSVCWTADAVQLTPASANAAPTYCMPGGTFSGSTNGGSSQIEYTQISGPGTITFTDPLSIQTDWTVDVPGTYTVELFKSFNTCDTLDTFTFDVIDGPTATEVATCANGQFTVEITFSGGTAPYSVLGTPISGNTYTSPTFASGTAVVFSYQDANGCGDDLLVQEFCACVTDAGTMDLTPIELCSLTDIATGLHNNDATPDADDIGIYILHTSPASTLGTVLATNLTGQFSFADPPMVPGQAYYISYVVGNDDGTGTVDLTDPCLSVAPGTEVVWIGLPSIDLGPDITSCTGSETIVATTDPAATVIWTYSATSPLQDAVLDDSTPGVLLFDGGSTGIHIIDATSTIDGCSSTASINIEVLPQGQITNLSENCIGLDYTVSFDIIDGQAPYLVDGVVIVGNQYESLPFTSGDSYAISVTDGNGCEIAAISGSRNCDCTTDAGTLTSTPLAFCGTADTARLSTVGNAVLDGDDIGYYVLHDGSPTVLGTILSQSDTGVFVFESPLVTDTTYYITYVVGSNDGSGAIDLDDPCLDFTTGLPVTWYDDYNIFYADSIVQCFNTLLLSSQANTPGLSTDLRIVSGPGSFALTSDDTLGLEYTFDATGNYVLEVRNSRDICLDIDTINLSILQPLDFTTYQDVDICESSIIVPAILDGQRLAFTASDPSFTFTEVGDSLVISNALGGAAAITMEGPSFFCNDIDSFEINFTPVVDITNIAYNCSADGSIAAVEVSLAGGDGTYTVNGEVTTDSVIVFTGIDPSLPFVVTVASATCPSVSDTILINCGCSNAPADLSQDVIELCPGDDISTTYLNLGQLGPDDSRLVILHDGNEAIIGNIFDVSDSPTFTLDPSINYPDTLWMTPYVGPTSGSGAPILDDSCAVLGLAQPVALLDTPSIGIDGPQELCLGDSGVVSITPTGTYPYIIEVITNDQTNRYTITDDQVINVPVLADDSTGTDVVVSLVDYPCPTAPATWSIVVNTCDCISYTYTVPDGICHTGESIDLSTWEANQRPATYFITQGDASLTGSELSISSTYQGSMQVQAIAAISDACDTTYTLTFDVEQTRALVLSADSLDVCPDDDQLINLDLYIFTASPIGSWSPAGNINTVDLPTGTTIATYTIPAGNFCPSVTQNFTITKTPPLEYIITSTDPDCLATLGSMGISIADSTLLGSVAVDGRITTDSLLPDLEPGAYSIVLSDINNCLYQEDVEITDIAPLEVSISQSDNGIDGSGYQVTSQVTGGSGNYQYQWVVAGDTLANNASVITIEIDADTEIELYVTDDLGCEASDIIVLRLTTEPFTWVMPNIFNPSSGGNASIRIPRNSDIVQVLHWKIYDRWGNLVFDTPPYDPSATAVEWSGTYRGEPVANGVYMYYIQYQSSNGSTEHLSGDITILR